MRIEIYKSERMLILSDGEHILYKCRIALGREPVGFKEREGDGRTPEGEYRVCLVKENGRYGRGLGISYPNAEDAERALCAERIDTQTFARILEAQKANRRPPWGSPLGGEIYLHEGGASSDWTQGCIAMESNDMNVLFSYREQLNEVIIRP